MTLQLYGEGCCSTGLSTSHHPEGNLTACSLVEMVFRLKTEEKKTLSDDFLPRIKGCGWKSYFTALWKSRDHGEAANGEDSCWVTPAFLVGWSPVRPPEPADRSENQRPAASKAVPCPPRRPALRFASPASPGCGNSAQHFADTWANSTHRSPRVDSKRDFAGILSGRRQDLPLSNPWAFPSHLLHLDLMEPG